MSMCTRRSVIANMAIAVLLVSACGGGRAGSTSIVNPGDVGAVDTLEPDVPEAATEPKPTTQPASAGAFGDGTWEAGRDITPGTYRLREPADSCYWARLKGLGGELNDIIANDNVFGAFAVVTIGKNDVAFESEGCGDWSKDLSQVTASKTSFGDGTFIVKTDITPGKYRNSGGDSCYWARLKGFSGELRHVIANDNVFGGSTIVTIASTDKGFTSSGCGTWKKR